MVQAIKHHAFSILKWILVMLVGLILFWNFMLYGSTLETWFNPVYRHWEITKTQKLTPLSTSVWIKFDKARECTFIGMSWYWGDPIGGYRRVVVDYNRKPDEQYVNRPTGVYEVGPWTVNMPEDVLLKQSRVDVFHSCHPLWITHTQVYPLGSDMEAAVDASDQFRPDEPAHE